jgi:energy-coupling factor transport system ATP-binding protein
VRDGRERLTEMFGGRTFGDPALRPAPGPDRDPIRRRDGAIYLKDVWFRYDRFGADVVRGLSFEIERGRLTCVVGGNGSGKSTVLKLIGGLRRPYRGVVAINGRKLEKIAPDEMNGGLVAMLPQDPRDILTAPTVGLRLAEAARGRGLTGGEAREAADRMSGLMELDGLLGRGPDELSGGERQRAALGVALLQNPEILLLDEPTKGMDGHFKEKLAALLKDITREGGTVVMVSHDIEFCASHADVCALFFNGGVVSSGAPAPFFSGNSYYTTAANRMSRHIFDGAVTADDVVRLCIDRAACSAYAVFQH